jgi:NADH dehydrogenase FAD-containing subunit
MARTTEALAAARMPHVVIVGGGFGGLTAALALRKAPVRVILIDRTNHHLFQPLLYQVATSSLAPTHIASSIRGILRRQKNVTVLMGEVTGVNTGARHVSVDFADRTGVSIPYDYLIVATGVRQSYFGHDEFARHAPGLKTVADAVAVRHKILGALELAESEPDPSKRAELMTFVLVGAGPTGVELAAAIAMLTRTTLKSAFRRIDPRSARIVLLEHAPRILGAFSEDLSWKAHDRLTSLGVEVRLGKGVEHIDENGVSVGGERIASKTVIWTAGVAPSPAGKWLGADMDHAGRVRVQPDLTLAGHPEVFVIGDVATLQQDGRPLPGVAQVAMQQGRFAARLIRCRLTGRPAPRPFRYFDKGSMAVIGVNFAVLQSGKVRLSGFLAWLIWVAVHLEFLSYSSLRPAVFLQWVWTYLTHQRGALLIVTNSEPPRPPTDSAATA